MPRYIRTFDNVIPKKLCEEMIDAFEKHQEVQPDPQPEYSTRRFLFLSDKMDWNASCIKLSDIANHLIEQYFDRPEYMCETRPAQWIDDGFVMACYDKGATCALHSDGQCAEEPYNGHRIATVILFLNDVPEGGETVFPMQDVSIKPVQGRAVVFPPGYLHPHEVLAPNSKRYICQTWITDVDLVVNERVEWS